MKRSMAFLAMPLALAAVPAGAQTIAEVGDAGETLATAQVITTGFTAISGTLTSGNRDDIDMYKFYISSPSAFSVTVTSNLSRDNDAQLFLFNSLGQLVGSNDDGGAGLRPGFSVGEFSSIAAGEYYLAYNLFDTDPKFTGGILSGWTRDPIPLQSGPYTLNITGARGITASVPEPATWALMILGFGAVGYSLRRRGARLQIA